MASLVAGVDTSTQATKVLVVDSETGSVVASGRAGHTVSGERGARETDPREWWEALRAALAETGRAGEVAALAIGGPATRTRRPRTGSGAAAPGDALERHALGAAGGRSRRDDRRRAAGRPGRQPAGCVVHGHEMGVAARARAGHRRRNRRDPAAARLPDRTPHRRGRHRPGGRVRDGVVVNRRRGVRGGHPRQSPAPARRADAPASARAAGHGRPGDSRRRLRDRAASGHAGRPGDRRQHGRGPWARTPRRPGRDQPRDFGDGVRGVRAAHLRPERDRGRLRRCDRPVPAARLHAELHAGRRSRGRTCSGSTATMSRRAARSSPCRGSTGSAPRTCRTPPARSPACATTRDPSRC